MPEVWTQWHLDEIDLLKLNVEGAEYEIIRELPIALLRNVKRVFLEFHDFHGFHFSELTEKLHRAGFQVTTRPQAWYFLTKIGYIDAVRRERAVPTTAMDARYAIEQPA